MLTPEQRMQVKRHLGYPLITATETLRSGMLPSGPDDLTFAIEPALSNLIPEAEAVVRELLRQLACIEGLQGEQRQDLGVLGVGTVQLAGSQGMSAVDDEYRKWAKKLSDSIGIPFYRHSQYHREIGSFSGYVVEQC